MERPIGGKWMSAVASGLIVAVAAACSSPSATSSVEVEGLGTAWRLDTISGAADFEFFDGTLYVLAGLDDPEVWRVELSDTIPRVNRITTPGLPSGRPRLLESNEHLLYVAGWWGPEVFALKPDGRILGEPRSVEENVDFLPWITGEFLAVGPPRRPGILIERLLPVRGREYDSRWGSVPETPSGPIARGDRSPFSDVFIDSDRSNRVHALLNAASALVQYDPSGRATLVRRLPPQMTRLGSASAVKGLGAPLERIVNGLEVTCGGEVWVSVGEEGQLVGRFASSDYRVLEAKAFSAGALRDAVWSECNGLVVGLSRKSGTVVVGVRTPVG